MAKKAKKRKPQKAKKLELKKSKNRNLQKARKAKKDEFYTQLADIAQELKHYERHFKGKVVYCNCDDPSVSNFFHYFKLKFKAWGLKKLIATCYRSQKVDRRSQNDSDHGICLEYDGIKERTTLLQGDGDFRSEESIELLKQVDIVATNPPFSLFREYVAQLVEYKKKFIIIGSLNAVKYEAIFPLIMADKLRCGYGFNRSIKFITPYEDDVVTVPGITWFTNLPIKKRNEELILYETYSPEAYPTYANYDAIEVSRTKAIPKDYDGLMGVPISFLDKYNPKQFELVGVSRELARHMSEVAPMGSYAWHGPVFYLANGEGTYRRLYDRLVIRRHLV